jgi:muramidase (phage lysozyme)
MRRSGIAVSVLLAIAGLSYSHEAIAIDTDVCFMMTSSGRRIDLNSLCKKNPPLQPRPRQVKKRVSPTTAYASSVNLQAFLRTIRYAEGTDSDDGYQILFTGIRFYNYNDHPRVPICSYIKGDRVCSTAAGAYQFLETTWDDVASSIGARDFSPVWQDRGAIELIRRAGAMEDVEAGRATDAIAKLAPVWASFPRWSGDGRGSYDQSVVPMEELAEVFRLQQIETAKQARLTSK